MYDDASLYYSFNPSAQPQQEKPHLPKHKRRQSVLERPNVRLGPQLATDCFLILAQEDTQADTGQLDRLVELNETSQVINGPPEATISRRAQSYSDFHDAVKAVLDQDVASKEAATELSRDNDGSKEKDITSELDFVGWYNGLEHELLDSSHDDYMSVTAGKFRRLAC